MDATRDLTWDEVHQRVVPLMRANNRTNVLYIAREYALLAAMAWAAATTYGSWAAGAISSLFFISLATVIVIAVAVVQHRLSGLAHDASHYVLFRNRLANELVSDLFLMFPIVAITQTYRVSHLGHHQ